MRSANKCHAIRIVTDCLITLVLLSVALKFFSIFEQQEKRGFFCDDESLKYPYQTDTSGGKWMLNFMSLFMPILIIIIGEFCLFLLQRTRTSSPEDLGLAATFLNLHYNLTPFVCGFAMNAIFVHVGKISLGRLRPHFFEVCQPYRRLDGSTCDNPKNHGFYIQDYECNGSNAPYISQEMLAGVHQSFPSGHASFMFYGMIFIVLYLQRFSKTLRQYGIDVGLIMMVVQMISALLAWFVALSRVMDYKHHWSDVLVGIVLGTSVAIAVTLFVCQQLNSVNSCPEGVKSSNSESTSTTTAAATAPNPVLVP